MIDILERLNRGIRRIVTVRPFSEGEAWWLFRAAALAEAVGWTLLVVAVAARHFDWSWYTYAIPIAGRIHGTFFIAYFAVSLAVSTSLRWPWWQFGLAILAGIPPYGSFIYERIVTWQRDRMHRRIWLVNAVYTRYMSKSKPSQTNQA